MLAATESSIGFASPTTEIGSTTAVLNAVSHGKVEPTRREV